MCHAILHLLRAVKGQELPSGVIDLGSALPSEPVCRASISGFPAGADIAQRWAKGRDGPIGELTV